MKRRVVLILTVMMAGLLLAAGCGKKDSKAEEATEASEEATEEASVVEITTDAEAEEPTQEYELPPEEELPSEPVTEVYAEEEEVETDEFGVTSIDETKLYAKETVRIRKEPNTDSDVSGLLKAGDEVTANGKNDEWHRIKKGDEVLYVKSEYLTETKPEKKEEAANAENTENTENTQNAAQDSNAQAAAAAAEAANAAVAAAQKAAADKSAADAAAAAEAANQAAAAQAATQAAQAAAAAAAAAPAAGGTTINCTDGALVVNSKQMDVINKYWGYTGDAVEFAGHHSKGQLRELFAAEGVN